MAKLNISDYLKRFIKEASAFIADLAGYTTRIVFAIVVLAIAYKLGIKLPAILHLAVENFPDIFDQKTKDFLSEDSYGGVALGGALIVSTLKGLSESLIPLWEFVENKQFQTKKFLTCFGQVFIAALGFGIAEVPIKNALIAPPIVVKIESGDTAVNDLHRNQLITFYVTFDEGLATLNEKDPQRLLIDQLTSALKDCVNDTSQQAEIKLRGFASSSGKDAENLTLAEGRAKALKTMILESANQKGLADHSLNISVDGWDNVSEMKNERIFIDRLSDNDYSRDAGRLNRRGEIQIIGAANCSRYKLR